MAMVYPVLFIICFLLSWAGTAALRKILLREAMLDQPNERSMHKIPVPRGGGLAVTGVILMMLILGSAWHHTWAHSLFLMIPFAVLMAISWLDDRRGLSPTVRLVVHLLAALVASFGFPADAMILDGLLPLWADRLLMIIGWAWFMNLYNFMDGIDGITGIETVTIGLGVIFIMLTISQLTPNVTLEPRFGIYAIMTAGAAAGFLMLNWHPAKIFLGDIGSVPLGFITGYILLGLALSDHLIAALILPMYYLADSGITLGKRLLRGEKIWQAHRQHFYQQAALRVGRHDKVVAWIIGGNLLLIACAVAAISAPWPSLAAALLVTAALLLQLHRMARS